MFDLDEMAEAVAHAEQADLLYFSLIALAIVEGEGRNRLLDLAAKRRSQGVPVADDINFRPALWPDLANAQAVSRQNTENCSIGLPTKSYERDLRRTEENECDIANLWRAGWQMRSIIPTIH